MIGYLRGTVRRVGADQVLVDTGGVGYLVSVPAGVRQEVGPVGSTVELHIHTHVREDQLALFGFASPEELEMFEMLIQVDGVGPKVGLSILGAASLDVLKRAILAEDVAPIRRATGVGPRTAQKVIIDLRPKLEAESAVLALPRAAAAGAQQAKVGVAAGDWAAQPTAQEALAAALRAMGR